MERGLLNFKDLIIGERIFRIPVYQRNYSWEERQLEDLWNDLLYLDVDKKHFFGTILLKRISKVEQSGLKTFAVYELIDGQQRMTSVLILLKEMISQLKDICEDDETKAELQELEKNYLKYKEVYKLELLGDDAEFFRNHIVDDKDYPDEILTPSRRRLKFAKTFFKGKFAGIRNSPGIDFREFLVQLKKKIDNLEIIRYPVESDADAVLVFETVNDRGKDLSRLEKTKSFLMHMVYLSESEDPGAHLKKINESFSRIFRYLESLKSTERGEYLNEEAIQRYHFIIYETRAKGDRDISYKYLDFMKKAIREIYQKDKEKCLKFVLKYTEDLEKAFFAATEIINFKETNKIGIVLDKLFSLERVANFFPLLVATWITFKHDEEKLREILKLVEVFTFRVYVVGRRRADTGEASACRLAYRIYSENLGFEEILHEIEVLIDYYEDDESFQSDMKLERFYKRTSGRDIKYLFYEYEKFLREQAEEPLEINLPSILSRKFEIEHIWADNPEDIPESLEDIHEQCKDKLGNLTIASEKWNKQWGNKPFAEKRNEYAKSSLRVQRELSIFNEWNQKTIEDRESKVIKFALQRWRIQI